MIILREVTKVFETNNYNIIALSNINLSFSTGEIVVILGRSGSGKSTLLNILGGFDNSFSGRYFFKYAEFQNMPQERINELRNQSIGFIFQHQELFNHLTVVENVEIALDVLGVTGDNGKRISALKALTLVGLRRHAYKLPWQLSGGEKQRLAIARAIVKNPDVIICDEPTAALDSATSKEILDLLASLCKDKLLIIATHNKSIVKNYGTRLIELRSGYLVRNELIKEDKSNVEIDEFEELVDHHLYEDHYISDNKIRNVKINDSNDTSKIVKNLDLDLSQFSKNREDTFYLDKKEYEAILEKRRKKKSQNDDLKKHGSTSLSMVNQKKFAFKSVLHHKKTYLLFTIFLFLFLSIMMVGFNLTQVVFIRRDNNITLNMDRVKANQVIQFTEPGKLGFYSEPPTLQISKDNFINNPNLYYETIINDPSFQFRFTYDTYAYLETILNKTNYQLYYDHNNYVVGITNEFVIFPNLQTEYEVHNIKIPTRVNSVMEVNSFKNLDFIYAETNQNELLPYLIKDSKLPKKEDEVLLPIGSLIDLGILDPQTTSIAELYETFENLDDDLKYIIIKQPVISLDKDGNTHENYVSHRFKIVGLLNSGEGIDSYYKQEHSQTMIFSYHAEKKLVPLINNKSNLDVRLIPVYMEINKKAYQKYTIDQVIKDYQKDYLNNEYVEIDAKIQQLEEPLFHAFQIIRTYLEKDPSLLYSLDLLTQAVDQDKYPNLTIRELLYVYLEYVLDPLSDVEKLEYCNNCDLENIDINFPDLFRELKSYPSLYNRFITGLLKQDSFIVEKTIHSYVYTNYYDQFNPSSKFVTNYQGDNLAIQYKTETVEGYYQMFYDYLYNYSDNYTKGKIYEELGFHNIVSKTDKLSKLSILPEQIKEDIALYYLNNKDPNFNKQTLFYSGLLFLIAIMSFLVIILLNLFGNIYHMFFIKRRKETGSLRMLGASYQDVKNIFYLESKYALYFAYLMMIIFMGMIQFITLCFQKDTLFTFHFIERYSRTFYNIDLVNFFDFGVLSLVIIFIFSRFLFFPILIKRNIKKNFKDIQNITLINNWDGE